MKISKIQLLLISAILVCGCEKLVEIDPPQDYLISKTIFESDETAISATTGLYATMMKGDFPISYNISLFTGLYGDDLEYGQTAPNLVALYNYALLPQDALTNSFWNNGFNYIYQTNSLIEGLTKSKNVSSIVKKQLLGEAMFIRAFWYYYLSNLYGPLPLILTTDYTTNARLNRIELKAIEDQIVNDLISAKMLLSEKYVAANSISETNDRIRPNKFAAMALLARVYLQMKEYQKAEDEATSIISNSEYDLSSIETVFKRTSKEVIWQLELPNTGYTNSYEANMFPLTAKPNQLGTSQSSILSSDLITLFSLNDKRRTEWIGIFVDNSIVPAVEYPFPAKLKSKSAPADEYTTPLRLAEVYLIRAEACAQRNMLTQAIKDVDKIRLRAGLDLIEDITPDISTQALVDSIANERRRELFCEWGIRWTDIRRSNNANTIMETIAAEKGAPWKPTAILWPIPLNEVLNSANNLKQNEGYN